MGVTTSGVGRGLPQNLGDIQNLVFLDETTTNSADSISITAGDGNNFSALNPGFITLPGTDGHLYEYTLTADVTIDLTGAHWGQGGNGDLTDAILRVVAIHDNDDSVIFGVAWQGNQRTVVNTATSTTGTDINLPEEILVSSALTAGTWTVTDIGWFRANFDDTGGAAEDLWAVQTGVGDLNIGSADGFWGPWNPSFTGFSVDPTNVKCRWTMKGDTAFYEVLMASGTSNASSFTFTGPVKNQNVDNFYHACGYVTDNGALQTTNGTLRPSDNSTTWTVYKDATATNNWTASGTKACSAYFFGRVL